MSLFGSAEGGLVEKELRCLGEDSGGKESEVNRDRQAVDHLPSFQRCWGIFMRGWTLVSLAHWVVM